MSFGIYIAPSSAQEATMQFKSVKSPFAQLVMTVFVILFSLSTMARSHGGDGSGGGNPEEADVTSKAKSLYFQLNSSPATSAKILGVPLDQYLTALNSTQVQCATKPFLTVMRGLKKRLYFDRSADSIFIDCDGYFAAVKTAGPAMNVVYFHEYMRKLNLEDSDYGHSSNLPEALQEANAARIFGADIFVNFSKEQTSNEEYIRHPRDEESATSLGKGDFLIVRKPIYVLKDWPVAPKEWPSKMSQGVEYDSTLMVHVAQFDRIIPAGTTIKILNYMGGDGEGYSCGDDLFCFQGQFAAQIYHLDGSLGETIRLAIMIKSPSNKLGLYSFSIGMLKSIWRGKIDLYLPPPVEM